jgi:predicted phage-related endonuclease
LIVEVKCHFQGSQSALWKDVRTDVEPPHYLVQIQHQLMVRGAQAAHLWVFDGSDGVLHPIERNEVSMEAIRAAWDGFQCYLDIDAPPLADGDTFVRDDAVWSETASAFLAAKRDAEIADAQLNKVRERLVALCRHPREQGAGGVCDAVLGEWKCRVQTRAGNSGS